MGLLDWIIKNIQVLIEIPIRLLTGSLRHESGWNHEWDYESISFPVYYFEALQFLLIVSFVLFILFLGIFIGYKLHRRKANTE